MLLMFLHLKRNRLHRHLLFQVQRGGLTGMEKGENVANAFSNYSSRGVLKLAVSIRSDKPAHTKQARHKRQNTTGVVKEVVLLQL